MAVVIDKTTGGTKKHSYLVNYADGQHLWTYLGPTNRVDASEYVENGDLTDDGERAVLQKHSVQGAPHGREHYLNTLDDVILDDSDYPADDDWYDERVRWEIDQVSEHYQREHDIRVALVDIDDHDQLREVVADIEELQAAGHLDGIDKIGTASDEVLAEKHGTQGGVTAEYEPEPRDIVGNSMGYQPTITLNADRYRHPTNDSDGVTSHGEEYADIRHALWHEVGHHLHLREYHDDGVDVQQVMMDHDGAVWDSMHAAMDGYREAVGEEYGPALRHDPIEAYAQIRAVELSPADDPPAELRELRERLEADAILDDE